jgi:hypothetical protein
MRARRSSASAVRSALRTASMPTIEIDATAR